MTLCHNGNNDICGSARYNEGNLGVSDFGEQVIHEMNRVGMLVDLSHAGEQSFYDALDISCQPVVCSHSSSRALCDHPRNLTDEQLKEDDQTVWNRHFFGKEASNANPVNYKRAVNEQYGESKGLEEFCEKAQLLNIEVMKGMYEAWNDKMWDDAAGLLIWMSHPAYPSFVWQTYDYYYDPTGAYWGAKKACELQVVTPALEAVIEANVYLSGVGADNGGLAVAHSFYNGITALGGHSAPHGDCVALGTLVQLVLERAPKKEFREVQDFCMEVGLPITLSQIGITTDEQIRVIAEHACAEGESIHNMVSDVTPDQLYAAILACDALGKERLEEKA